jgi:hypothetical protein
MPPTPLESTGLAVRRGVARAHGVDGAETVGTGLFRGAGNGADIRRIRGQLGDDRDVHCGFHRGDDLRNHRRILAHGHAVAAGMRAGQVQLETVGYRRQQFGYGNEFLDAAAEDRGQQEAVCRHVSASRPASAASAPGLVRPTAFTKQPGAYCE